MADEALFADRLWQHLSLTGELEAELFRWRAIHEAARLARELGLTARPRDRYLAREEMAHAHGLETWARMEQGARSKPWWPSSEVISCGPCLQVRRTLSQVRRLDRELSEYSDSMTKGHQQECSHLQQQARASTDARRRDPRA